MKIQGLFFAIFIFSMVACKTKNETTSPTAKEENVKELVGDAYGMINQEDLKTDEVQKMRSSALGILDHRYKESGKKSVTIIEKDLWQYDGIVKNSNMMTGDSLQGRWIDFKDDLTYEYGRYGDTDGTGQYFYDFDKANLLLIDDNEHMKPQEFEVKALNDMIVIIGSYVYKDNNLQAKITRKAEKPIKK